MTEKQRWLLRELEGWQESSLTAVGRYQPARQFKMEDPPAVRQARRTIARCTKLIGAWEQRKKVPWEREREKVYQRHKEVRRIILFDKTEVALAALKQLTGKK